MLDLAAESDWISSLKSVMSTQPTGTGMSADDASGRFDASYDTAVSKFDPFPGRRDKIDQLQGLYGTVGDAYDVTDTLAALGQTRQTNLLGGEQAANTAARRYEESNLPGASNGVGGSMLRAQALLPYLQADTAAASKEREYADSAKQNALGAAADIATKLAQLEQDYTNSLANYSTQKANFGVSYAGKQTDAALSADQFRTGHQLQAWELAAKLAENRRTSPSALSIGGSGSGSGSGSRGAGGGDGRRRITPMGNWTTNNSGQVTSGFDAYNAYQEYLKNG